MKYLLSIVFLAYAYDIDQSKVCTCNDINYQPDCLESQLCDWINGGCSVKNCPAGKGFICSVDPYGTIYTNTTLNSITVPTLTQCSRIIDQLACYGSPYCTWANKMCMTQQCSNYLQQITCFFTFSDDFKNVRLCNWINKSCVEATNLKEYNSSTCYSKTAHLAAWQASKNECVECRGNLNSQLLILGILIILI
ncbi:hypothetical protein pb186bvf_013863 [Paramecium bursaria]